jgi:hypothetical protein
VKSWARVASLRTPPSGAEIRDAWWLDDLCLLVSDSQANIWRITATGQGTPELVHDGEAVLAPVARWLGKASVEAAGGGYPRLVAGPSAIPLIVNTDDFVLVGYDARAGWRMLAAYWGMYYPRLSLSPDARWLASAEDLFLLVDTRDWSRHLCDWSWREHEDLPLEDLSLEDLPLAWTWRSASEIVRASKHGFRVLDLAANESTWRDLGGTSEASELVMLSGGRCVALQYSDLVQIDLEAAGGPVELRRVPIDRGYCHDDMHVARDAPRAVFEGREGVQAWDLERLELLADPVPGVHRARLSPSGMLLVTFERSSVAHVPGGPPVVAPPTLWRLP